MSHNCNRKLEKKRYSCKLSVV